MATKFTASQSRILDIIRGGKTSFDDIKKEYQGPSGDFVRDLASLQSSKAISEKDDVYSLVKTKEDVLRQFFSELIDLTSMKDQPEERKMVLEHLLSLRFNSMIHSSGSISPGGNSSQDVRNMHPFPGKAERKSSRVNEELGQQILECLKKNGGDKKYIKAHKIAEHIFGEGSNKSMVNSSIYALEKQKLVEGNGGLGWKLKVSEEEV